MLAADNHHIQSDIVLSIFPQTSKAPGGRLLDGAAMAVSRRCLVPGACDDCEILHIGARAGVSAWAEDDMGASHASQGD